MKILKGLIYLFIAYKAFEVMGNYGAMNFWTYASISFALLGLLELIEFGKEKRNGNNNNK